MKSNVREIKVTINWQKPISIYDFENEQMSHEESGALGAKEVIYIFEGENDKKNGIDIGQTTRKLAVRIKEHLNDKDYLEEFGKNQKVRCGIVSADSITINRDLLEQVEGVLIQYIQANVNNVTLCNHSKKETYSAQFNIQHILNLGEKGLFPKFIIPQVNKL